MPIYMDVHIVPGVKAIDVAAAHHKDLIHQSTYGCKCMTYWIDEDRESIFCLVEALDKKAVEEMHSKAHGLIPNKIIEVSSQVVESFLGRIYDPSNAVISESGLKVFTDPSFRILLLTTTIDPILLNHTLGPEQASSLLNSHHQIVRKNLAAHSGREVEFAGTGFIASFSLAHDALACALAIQQSMPIGHTETLALRMAIHGGEPIEKSSKIFGDTIRFAGHLCSIAKEHQVVIAHPIKELLTKDFIQARKQAIHSLAPPDEELLGALFDQLEENWQEPDFDITGYGRAMAMSASHLYRKTVSLTGKSPNDLLRDFRLEKAKEMLRNKHYNIAQITFESGFTSASYFTKCFKKKYGLLPMSYLEMLK